MITKYKIEVWDSRHNGYIVRWEDGNFEMAEKMINKPYYQNVTRRLVKTTEEVLYRIAKKR